MIPTTPNALHLARALNGFPRRGLYFNTPQGGEGGSEAPATAEAATSVETAADKQDTAAPAEGAQGGSQVGSGGYTEEQAYRLHEIEARIAANPDEQLSEEDLALYEAALEGKLQAKARPEGNAEGGEADAPAVSEHIAAAMKEVGAGSEAELVEKIKGLRQAVTGRDAQAYAALEARFREADAFRRSEAQLYEDAKAGKPEAIKFLEEHRGIRVQAAGAAGADGKPALPAEAAPEPLFSEEDDKLVGGALSKFKASYEQQAREIAELKGRLEKTMQSLEAQDRARAQQTAEESARSQTVDEMVEVAQFNDELKALPNLKNRLRDFLSGKDDAQLAPWFSHLFKVAQDEGCSLKAAYYLERGRNADALVAKAREDGVKAALGKPSNKSMSGVPSREEAPGLQTVTEAQLAAYENGDLDALPASWFTAEGDFNKARIPAKFHQRLGVI